MKRRDVLRCLGGVAVALPLLELGVGHVRAAEGEGRVIELEARRFRYTPNEIHARAGETLTLAIRSVDFVHGFSMPELGLRSDLPPGRVTRIRLADLPVGRWTFLCDNFCGEGHEEMNGMLIVEA
ncbi:MAG: cupredoxin domain-containing protein [Proteobacteria bacterium]|nr:cupredoxin domain-containing protein [Pseudomonadota bacterium]